MIELSLEVAAVAVAVAAAADAAAVDTADAAVDTIGSAIISSSGSTELKLPNNFSRRPKRR